MKSNEWKKVKIKEVAKTSSGGTPSRSIKHYYEGNIPWIKSGELKENFITHSEEHISPEALKYSSAKLLPKDCLLVAMYGANVGRYARLNIDASTNQAICAIQPNESSLNIDFLTFYFAFIKDSLVQKAFGGAQPNISQNIIQNLELPLPPLDEQKRIVEKIKKAFEKIEEVNMDISKSLNSINNIHRARQYKIFETEIDSGTAIVKLSDVVVFDKKTITPISNEKYYYLSLEDIQSNTGKVLNKNYVDGGSIKSTKLKFSKHNILYSKLRPYLNKVVLPDEDGICVTDLVPLKPNTDLIGKNYLWHYLRSYYVLDYVNSKMTGIKMPRLRTEDFNNLPVILPSKERQNEIVQLFSNNELEIELTKSVDNISKTISKLKQSILKKAFSGEL